MDDGLDDLFGDAAPLQLSIPVSQALVSRLNESCLSGCCQKAAWSKSGVIAHITANGLGISVQYLLCDPQSGQWGPSKLYQVNDIAAVQNGVELIHLSWDTSGRDCLAALDARGRVSIFVLVAAVNRVKFIRKCTVDPEDDLSSIVGLTWLQDERSRAYFYRPSVKKNGRWASSMTQQNSYGPKYPYQRPPLVAVTQRGILKVIYQDKEGRWSSMQTELESIAGSFALLTHSSMCVEKGNNADGMLLATHSNGGELRVYRIRMDFEKASFNVHHLTLIPSFGPARQSGESIHTLDQEAIDKAQLTCLELVPAGPDSASKDRAPPHVFAAFSLVARSFQGTDDIITFLCNWQLKAEKASLHSSVSQLSSRKTDAQSTAQLPVQYRLEKAIVLEVSRVLLAVQHVNLSTTLALSYNDGHIEFRDSKSLEVLPPDVEDSITGLGQIGFAFPVSRICLHTTLSPNSCASFSIDEDYLYDVLYMQCVDPRVGIESTDDATLETINEAFVMHLSVASRGVWADDILATLQLFSRMCLVDQMPLEFGSSTNNLRNFNQALLSGVYHGLGVSLDHALDAQPEQWIRNMFVQRCLGIQTALNFHGENVLRPVEGLVALIMLQLRYIGFALLVSCSPKPTGAANDNLKRPETVAFVVPLATWLLSLMSFIVDEILSLRNYFEDAGISPNHIDANLINQRIQQTQSPALLLLYSSLSRSVLQNSWKCCSLLAVEGDKHGVSTTLGRIFQEFKQARKKSPIDLPQFEKLLGHVDTSVKSSYQQPNLSGSDRKNTEEQMLIKAEIPNVLIPSVLQLLYQTLTPLREEIDEAKLYFLDTSQLGLTDDNYSKRQNSKHPTDALTKLQLLKTAPLRRCTRCGAFTEDLLAARKNGSPPPNPFLIKVGSYCFCGSPWMVLDNDDKQALKLKRL